MCACMRRGTLSLHIEMNLCVHHSSAVNKGGGVGSGKLVSEKLVVVPKETSS